jgi:hypothetical protein
VSTTGLVVYLVNGEYAESFSMSAGLYARSAQGIGLTYKRAGFRLVETIIIIILGIQMIYQYL